MKLSQFNRFIIFNRHHFIFNSKTRCLALLDEEGIELLEKIKNNPNFISDTQTYKSMLDGGIIVGNDFSEIAEVSESYMQFKKGSNKSAFGFVVLPTLNCIYDCPYCYEDKKPHQMSTDTATCVEKFIINSIENEATVAITWYGGEPLMATHIIDKISETVINHCDATNKKYDSFIVTNGYLIEDATLEFFKRNRISGCQITLDGAEETHNTKRFLKTNKTGTFKKTISGILKVLSINMSLSIRINVDKNNLNELNELLYFLKKEGIGTAKISLG
ncbi:MAG: radical SAM protein [Christensenellaceae bacterium]|nr:radical SAM protein [Christensenellaceae bacterium]